MEMRHEEFYDRTRDKVDTSRIRLSPATHLSLTGSLLKLLLLSVLCQCTDAILNNANINNSDNLISTFDIFRTKQERPSSPTHSSNPTTELKPSIYSASLPVIVSKTAPETRHESLNHSPKNPYTSRPEKLDIIGSDRVTDKWSPRVHHSHHNMPALSIPKEPTTITKEDAIEHDIREDLLDTMTMEPYAKFLEPDDSYKHKADKGKERPDVSVTIYHHQAIHDPINDYGSGKPWNFYGNGYGVHYGYDLDGNYSKQKGYQFEKAHGREFCKEGHACELDKTKAKQIKSAPKSPIQKHIFNVIKNENVDVNGWFDKDNPDHNDDHRHDDHDQDEESKPRRRGLSRSTGNNYGHYPMGKKDSFGEDPGSINELEGAKVIEDGHIAKLVNELNTQQSLEFAEPEGRDKSRVKTTTVSPYWPYNMNPRNGPTPKASHFPHDNRPHSFIPKEVHFDDQNTNYFENHLHDNLYENEPFRRIPLTTPVPSLRPPLFATNANMEHSHRLADRQKTIPVSRTSTYATTIMPALSRTNAAKFNHFTPTSANVYQKSPESIPDNHFYYNPSFWELDNLTDNNNSWPVARNNPIRPKTKKRLTSKYLPINGVEKSKLDIGNNDNNGNRATHNPYS